MNKASHGPLGRGAFILALVAVVAVPVVLIFLAWRRYVSPLLRPAAPQTYMAPIGAIETSAVVHGAVNQPLPQ